MEGQTPEVAPATDEPTAGRTRRRTREVRLRTDVLWSLLLAAAAVLLSVLGVLGGTQISALDEHTHLDYAYKVSQGELPYTGVPLSDYTLEEWSCRGQQSIADALPPCEEAAADEVAPSDYPARGENYNAWHPPLYYATAAGAGLVAEALGQSFTTGARLSGGLWLAAAVVAMYGVLRHWRLRPALAASGAAVIMAVPSIVHASSTVTNDAPAALLGVGALWVLTRVFRDGRTGWFAWVLPTVIAALAASIKLMSSVAILTAVGVVALSALPQLRDRNWGEAVRRLLIAVVPVLAVGASAVAWSAFQSGRAVESWTNPIAGVNTAPVTGAPFDEWAPTLTSAFGLVDDFYVQPELMSSLIWLSVGALTVLLTAAPFMALVTFRPGQAERVVGWAALIGAVAVPLLVQGQEFLRGGGYFRGVSARYAVTLVPMTIAALTLVAHERRYQVLAYVVAVCGYLAMLLSFSGIA